MTLIVRLIAKYALWIYVLCGMGMLLYLRAALSARNEGSQAIFSLDREGAAKKVYSSSGMILVLLLIVVGVYALSNYVELPPITAVQTPTPAAGTVTTTPGAEIIGTSAPETTPLGPGTAQEQLTPASPGPAGNEPTPTRRPRVTTVVLPTIEANTPLPQVAPATCPHANAQIAQPGQNQAIDAGIDVRGTATKEGFDRYEFKFQSRDVPGDDWHWVETFRDPVTNGSLGFWSTAHLPPGRYQFMLIVIDKTGNSQECIVPVIIQR